MTVRISGGDLGQVVDKAVTQSQGNSFELQDVTPIVERKEVQPGLLTAILGGESQSIFLETNVFKYDDFDMTAQLPNGKRFDEFGNDLQKDRARNLFYEVGSFGLRANVAPKDYANRRIPGTTDTLMDEAYLVGMMNDKMQMSWSLFTELAIAQLLTTDTNITLNGPQPEYNFYTDILGSARPAATDMMLDDNTRDHFQEFNIEKDRLEEDLARTMNTASSIVVICGSDFFSQRLLIEKQQGGGGSLVLNREMSGLDLASMAVPESNMGSAGGRFPFQFFDSHDGLRYIRYSSSILGTKLIPDDMAYMVPIGAETFMKMVYAPAQTRQYVNTVAQSTYGWSVEDERNGVTLWTERNVLPITVNPQLIRRLTT